MSPPPPPPATHPVVAELELLVRARAPVAWIVTHEERRAERLLQELGRRLSREVVAWSATDGFDHPTLRDAGADPVAAIERVRKSSEKRLYVLRDFHAFTKDPRVARQLRDAVRDLKSTYKTLFVLSPVLEIPPELEKDVVVVDLPLPDEAELSALLKAMLGSLPAHVPVTRDPELLERFVEAALGPTESEAEGAFAKAIVSNASFGEADLPLIIAEKKQVLRKTGILEFHELEVGLSSVGGLEGLKGWLADRSRAFSEKAREYGLPAPRGILLLGVQGCGKSLCAKAVANEWKLPLLRLDIGRIFSSFIGSSEANAQQAIRIAESLAPIVLWIDEIEKGLSGVRSSGSVDAGVTARVFGAILTWMQEKKAPVFVVATANQVRDLPPELLRKGRFDEIFFIDLPDATERAAIFRIHLARRRRDPARFEMDALVAATEGWSGAEIEQAIVSALYATFPKDRDIETADVLQAIAGSVPLSRTMAEDIQDLRSWARTRARGAS